ncbi:MAG: hypothetical protein VKK04_26090 [Synechococcales bacterium]|nr:hypothetical protein [Synechococcales bacterium]
MKRRFFLPLLAGAILFTSLGLAKLAVGQSSENQPSFPGGVLPTNLPYEDLEVEGFDPDSIPFEDHESDPEVEARNLEQENGQRRCWAIF